MTFRPSQQTTVVTDDPASTRALGSALAAAARPGDLISLVGDLGAGKTQFAKGFGAGLGVTDTIVSPSFVLMAEYRGRLPLFHIDLYRLADAAEAMAGGLVDERQSEGVTLIEWAERLADAMPVGRLDVRIDGTGDDPRTITLVAEDDDYTRYLDAAAGAIGAAGSAGRDDARSAQTRGDSLRERHPGQPKAAAFDDAAAGAAAAGRSEEGKR